VSDPDPELREVLGAALSLLGELAEEGVERFERSAAAEPTALSATRPVARTSEGHAQAASVLLADPAIPLGASLETVRAALGECRRCRLSEGRTQIVFGEGDPSAAMMFVGEGPGEQEDSSGVPFCGRAGELLTNMIEKGLGIARREVYICNIVKCRPPNNRTPQQDEVAACRLFLDAQISAVRPRVIVSLGKPASSLLLGREIAITKVRGTWHEYRGIPVMPTFHPAFVLRQYTPENRRLVWEDLKRAHASARGDIS
jgi:DNA polymerase